MEQLILASASPRRKQLLEQVGAEFTIETCNQAEELKEGLTVREQVQDLALQKAQAVAAGHKSGLVIGADTIVVQNGIVYGKPKNDDEARAMLRNFSGTWHSVLTGVAVVDASKKQPAWQAVEETRILFRELTEDDIEAYLSTGEHRDKAGSYGIQGAGALLAERLEGCYFNVVGLPLQRVAQGLRHMGIDLYAYKQRREGGTEAIWDKASGEI